VEQIGDLAVPIASEARRQLSDRRRQRILVVAVDDLVALDGAVLPQGLTDAPLG
jgi:hypothetical protein